MSIKLGILATKNMHKAVELADKRTKKLHIAGFPATAESYGIYIEGPKHLVEVYFNFTVKRWWIGPSGHEFKRELPENASRKEFLDCIRAYAHMQDNQFTSMKDAK